LIKKWVNIDLDVVATSLTKSVNNTPLDLSCLFFQVNIPPPSTRTPRPPKRAEVSKAHAAASASSVRVSSSFSFAFGNLAATGSRQKPKTGNGRRQKRAADARRAGKLSELTGLQGTNATIDAECFRCH
jgi:hypothetical protein